MCNRRWPAFSCRRAISTTSFCEGRNCPLNDMSGKLKLVDRLVEAGVDGQRTLLESIFIHNESPCR